MIQENLFQNQSKMKFYKTDMISKGMCQSGQSISFTLELWEHYDPHDIEMLSALQALCEGNLRSSVDSLHKGPVMQSFDILFIVSQNKLLNKQLDCQWIEIIWQSCKITVRFITNHTSNHKDWSRF